MLGPQETPLDLYHVSVASYPSAQCLIMQMFLFMCLFFQSSMTPSVTTMTRLDRLSTTSWKMKVCIQEFVFVFLRKSTCHFWLKVWTCDFGEMAPVCPPSLKRSQLALLFGTLSHATREGSQSWILSRVCFLRRVWLRNEAFSGSSHSGQRQKNLRRPFVMT